MCLLWIWLLMNATIRARLSIGHRLQSTLSCSKKMESYSFDTNSLNRPHGYSCMNETDLNYALVHLTSHIFSKFVIIILQFNIIYSIYILSFDACFPDDLIYFG